MKRNYKYIPDIKATKLQSGGYIFHNGINSVFDDYKRNLKADIRLSPIIKMLDNRENYKPKYENWYSIYFQYLNEEETKNLKLDVPFSELSEDVKSKCFNCERHLACDLFFENYVFEQTNKKTNEIDTINLINLIENFKHLNIPNIV